MQPINEFLNSKLTESTMEKGTAIYMKPIIKQSSRLFNNTNISKADQKKILDFFTENLDNIYRSALEHEEDGFGDWEDYFDENVLEFFEELFENPERWKFNIKVSDEDMSTLYDNLMEIVDEL
jgi:hypothetical protein